LKTLIISLLSLTLLNTHLFADDGEINTDTARAYEAHLVTFMWPEGQSSEQINYKNVLSTGNLLRLTKGEEDKSSTTSNTSGSPPFGNIEERLGGHVKILANQQWTLIFNHPGDTISKTFHSEQEKDGYPELTGSISVKLGRYLESDIRYQHYLFDSFTQPNTQGQSGKGSFFSQGRNTLDTEPEFKEFDPALVLALNQRNKTASKKVNYLDHPTIGTLLYFEPIELEDAMDKIALLSMMPETGKSLNYDELQSTNELSLK
jgi:plasmid maintenance system killer protein